MVYPSNSTPTTEMEVTSIRLERELKNRLKAIAGGSGYQALIREILWAYVQQGARPFPHPLKGLYSVEDIRATFPATAQREEECVLTGQPISPQESMLLGLTPHGTLVPLSSECLTKILVSQGKL